MKQFLLNILDWSIVITAILFIGFAFVLDGLVGGIMKWLLIAGFIVYLSKIL